MVGASAAVSVARMAACVEGKIVVGALLASNIRDYHCLKSSLGCYFVFLGLDSSVLLCFQCEL